MPKKPRRVRKQQPRPQARLSASQLVQPRVSEPSVAPAAAAPLDPKETDLRQEYRYVLTDLKRIGIIALIMLVVLLVLAFVLI